jgi:hypothetical protein
MTWPSPSGSQCRKWLNWSAVCTTLAVLPGLSWLACSKQFEELRSQPAASASVSAGAVAAAHSPPVPPVLRVLSGRLSPQRLAAFYHEPEGSEVLPLFLLRFRHLRQEDGKQFMENLERFGLLGDPRSETNPEGVPVGMTVDRPRDVSFLGLQMVGFNCAACHVGELEADGQWIRVVGGPSRFDIKRFYREFGQALTPFAKSVSGAWQVYQAFQSDRAVTPAAGAATVDRAPLRSVVESLETFDPRSPATPFERRFAEELQKQFDLATTEDRESPERPRTIAPDAALSDRHLRARDGAKGLLEREGSQGGDTVRDIELPPSVRSITPAARTAALSGALSEFSDVVRLLVARVRLAKQIGGSSDAEDPGPGRVDAFVTAKNTMFGTSDPTNSPVSFPHIWGLEKLAWLHWDGNTNSLMERNMGQAIGLGAVIDKQGNSTLLPRRIHALELWARELDPPEWPFALDHAKAKRGEAHFIAHCARCHDGPDADSGSIVSPLGEIGTDRHRAENFASTVNGTPLPAALAKLIGRVKKQAYADTTPRVTPPEENDFEAGRTPVVWRATLGYANRSLRGIWATAPYLHNGSVPTLADLLDLESRPATFPVGRRAFDTQKVGLLIDTRPGPVATFDTSKPGNSNAGHPFGSKLTSDEKGELVEYLKTR